jgi:hypothetical protein
MRFEPDDVFPFFPHRRSHRQARPVQNGFRKSGTGAPNNPAT